jgi:hypothetical protein
MRNPQMDQTPETREREYWRTLVRNELLDSTAASDLRRSSIEVLAFRIANAIQGELAASAQPGE